MSTNFEVIQAQRDLAAARNAELLGAARLQPVAGGLRHRPAGPGRRQRRERVRVGGRRAAAEHGRLQRARRTRRHRIQLSQAAGSRPLRAGLDETERTSPFPDPLVLALCPELFRFLPIPPRTTLPPCRSSRSPSSPGTRRRTSTPRSTRWPGPTRSWSSTPRAPTTPAARARAQRRARVRPGVARVLGAEELRRRARRPTTGSCRSTPTSASRPAGRARFERSSPPSRRRAATRMPRVSFYLGRWIRTTDWYPDHQLRLYDRRAAQWVGDFVHERRGGARRAWAGFRHDLQHLPVPRHRAPPRRRSTATRRSRRGRCWTTGGRSACRGLRASASRRVPAQLRCCAAAGGTASVGLVVSVLNSYYVFLKFAKLWEARRATAWHGNRHVDAERPDRHRAHLAGRPEPGAADRRAASAPAATASSSSPTRTANCGSAWVTATTSCRSRRATRWTCRRPGGCRACSGTCRPTSSTRTIRTAWRWPPRRCRSASPRAAAAARVRPPRRLPPPGQLVLAVEVPAGRRLRRGVRTRSARCSCEDGIARRPGRHGARRHRRRRAVEQAEPLNVREEFWFPPHSLVVGNIAALVPHKGQKYLVDAAAVVVREVPEARFVILGEGELRQDLEHRSGGCTSAQHVVLAGFRADVLGLLKGLDLFVMSSVTEGLGTRCSTRWRPSGRSWRRGPAASPKSSSTARRACSCRRATAGRSPRRSSRCCATPARRRSWRDAGRRASRSGVQRRPDGRGRRSPCTAPWPAEAAERAPRVR